jgi:hypothetical protein
LAFSVVIVRAVSLSWTALFAKFTKNLVTTSLQSGSNRSLVVLVLISMPGGVLRAEFFVASDVPVEKISVTEGTLKIVTVDELHQMQNVLTPSAQFALEAFLGRALTASVTKPWLAR